MSFLAPLFFLGLGALAIPVVVHLIQRERKNVVRFPSLMFLERIPYQSVRRRRIRHWFLLLMRAAAMALIVAAFARPFFEQGALAVTAAGGAREVVILLDRSASMAYGDTWTRAQAAARQAVAGVNPEDRATLVLFARNAEETMRGTSDQIRLNAAIDLTEPTAGATRYGPALKLAQSVLAESALRRREVILISDLQRSGWTGAEDVRFPEGTVVTPVGVGAADAANLAVTSAAFARTAFSDQERVTLTAVVVNRSAAPRAEVPVTLRLNGLDVETKRVNLAANQPTTVVFTPFTLADTNARGTITAGDDPLPADNTFQFVLAPGRAVRVLVVEPGGGNESLFLSRALGIGTEPGFAVEVVPATRFQSSMLVNRSMVVLNGTPFPPGAIGGSLADFVEQGGGLFVALGPKTTWPANDVTLLPGRLGSTVDRLSGRGGAIGYLDYSHPVLELFKAPRSGDFSSAHVFRYRNLQIGPDDHVLARFDDGAVALAERRLGAGRVIVWTTTLDDNWTDLPLRPVYLPLVHQVGEYLARYQDAPEWYTVGQALDFSTTPVAGLERRVVLAPSGERVDIGAGEGRTGALELDEQGFYEVRDARQASSPPFTVAVNLEAGESDLAPLDADELVAALSGHAVVAAVEGAEPERLTPEAAERRQGIWWYLLVAGLLLLTAEMAVANRLSQKERFL